MVRHTSVWDRFNLLQQPPLKCPNNTHTTPICLEQLDSYRQQTVDFEALNVSMQINLSRCITAPLRGCFQQAYILSVIVMV